MGTKTAKIFSNGGSQAIRLPKEFRFTGDEVVVRKEGTKLVIYPKPASWEAFFHDTPLPSEDYMVERVDLPPQVRNGLT